MVESTWQLQGCTIMDDKGTLVGDTQGAAIVTQHNHRADILFVGATTKTSTSVPCLVVKPSIGATMRGAGGMGWAAGRTMGFLTGWPQAGDAAGKIDDSSRSARKMRTTDNQGSSLFISL